MQRVDIACLKQVCCRFDSCQGYSRRWSYGALWGLISLYVPGSNPGSATKCRCDVTGNMRLSYSLLAGTLREGKAYNSCHLLQMQTWCNWQHRGLVRSRYGFNPHRLIQMCWCSSTAEQLFCKQSVAGSTPVTSPRMWTWCSGSM